MSTQADAATPVTSSASQPAEQRVAFPPPTRLAIIVLIIGLAVTAALGVSVDVVNSHNERRLLALQAKQAAAVLQISVPNVQTPLMSAAEIAEASGGSVARFRAYMARDVFGRSRRFASATLWRLTKSSAQPVSSLGPAPPASTPGLVPFVSASRHTNTMLVHGQLRGPHPALWYAATAFTRQPAYAVSAVAPLSPGRRFPVKRGSPFSELHFAIYLGTSQSRADLIGSDVHTLPLTGTKDVETIPFGSTKLTVVVTPAERLGGTLSAWLWWLVAIVGVLLSIAAAVTAEWLVRRRRTADLLRVRVESLLAEQRGIAETLQRALLPKALPAAPGIRAAARYVPGTHGAEVGGDWYDVVVRDDGCVFFVIGDVSGRGVPAAAVMASLRFAIRGFITEGHPPDLVLSSAGRLLDLRDDGHFATVLCGLLDLDSSRLVVANAGHLPLVLADCGGTARLLQTDVDPPIGVAPTTTYRSSTLELPRAGTVLAYTDGLVERRGENLDDGLHRLAQTIPAERDDLDSMLDFLVAELLPQRPTDDTALLGLRWT